MPGCLFWVWGIEIQAQPGTGFILGWFPNKVYVAAFKNHHTELALTFHKLYTSRQYERGTSATVELCLCVCVGGCLSASGGGRLWIPGTQKIKEDQ